jgi:UDP-N-acetylglucosamine 3-dehydrogenase
LNKVNVAVIGCGLMGKNHVRVFSKLDLCNLLAVSDIDINRARRIGNKYNIDWYKDPSKIFRNKDINLVSICTPTLTHTELTLEAIEGDKHVLVEKPMTNTVIEAERVVKAAKQKNVMVMVGFIERFNPAIKKAEELIKKGEVGEIVLTISRRLSNRPGRITDVGVIKDLAIHDIDVICHLLNDKLDQIFAITKSVNYKNEDYAHIILRFRDGKVAIVEASWLNNRKIRNLTIIGKEGIIEIDYKKQKVVLKKQKEISMPIIKRDEPLKIELEYFLNAIISNKSPEPSGEDGLKAIRICETALRSAGSKNLEIVKNI